MQHQSSRTYGDITEDQVQSYHRDGYLILRQRFTPDETEAFQCEAKRLFESDLVNENNLRTPMRALVSGGRAVERVDPVVDVSDLFYRVVTDDRILRPLEQIFGEPAHLFKDKLIFKHPGMHGYTMHQDYAWWQPQGNDSPLPTVAPDKILSVMIAIDAADALNGAIELFPGYHGCLLSPRGALRNMSDEEIAKIDLSKGILGDTAPGDVVIFHSLTPHRSESNRSTGSRRQLYMTYNAASAGDVYAAQQAHYRSYILAGRKNGGETQAFFR